MALSAQHAPLIESARLGDPSALNQVLKLCQPDVRRYAYRHCLVSDVDDAVQETLMIVSRHIQSLRLIAAFSGWLFQIVRRECRRLERQVFRLDPYDELKMQDWLSTSTDAGIRLDLIAALESLPMHYRDIVLLRDFHEMSLKEIAAHLHLSAPATKSRLHRARHLVREYLLS